MLQNLFWTWPFGAPPPCSREGGRAAGEAGAWLPPASPLAAAGRLCSAGAEAPAAVSRVSPLVCGLPAPGSPLHPPRSRLGPARQAASCPAGANAALCLQCAGSLVLTADRGGPTRQPALGHPPCSTNALAEKLMPRHSGTPPHSLLCILSHPHPRTHPLTWPHPHK